MPQEGAIVRNKATGQMGRVVNGQVVPIQQGGPPAFIPGRPKPVSPVESERLEMERERLRIAQSAEARNQEKADAASAKTDRSRLSSLDSITAVLDQIDEVENDVKDSWFGGLGETGYSGWMMRNLPGSAAYDLQRSIDMIDANTAFNRLQEMRENSPTGGAVGNVSDTDMRLLKSTIASLDPNQSQESFLKNLHATRRAYRNVLEKLGGKPSKKKTDGDWKIEEVRD